VSFPLNGECCSKVDTIVVNINATYFGVEKYFSIEEKAVAYFYFLIKDHPFVDGNKRTAVLTFGVVCNLNQLEINKDISLDSMAVFLEKVQEQDHHKVIKSVAKILFDKKE
jgi:prophage maintenance system killer protein